MLIIIVPDEMKRLAPDRPAEMTGLLLGACGRYYTVLEGQRIAHYYFRGYVTIFSLGALLRFSSVDLRLECHGAGRSSRDCADVP